MSEARPSGTVTFLFTDIEGSTQRWDRRREAMQEAVRRHDALMRTSIESHAGHVFKTIGDAFCAAFSRVDDAVAAVLAAQRALAAADFSAVDGILVRMALHTGTADERDDDYFGPTVNRVARLLSIGHGGQILLSDASAELVAGQLADGLTLRDLGRHHLKDLSEPESVRQLCAPDLRVDFPALRSVGSNPTNLPQLPSSFVGREAECGEIEGLLRTNRMVTLVGPGGIGKTRLSLQVGGDVRDVFADGVWFTNLAPLRDAALVSNEIAAALGVAEQANRPMIETLVQYLAPKELLLIVDNCEHVIDEAAKAINAVVRGCPKVHILATSREGLRSDGETIVRIPVLGVPPEGERLTVESAMRYPAIGLFVDRAKAADGRFALTEENVALVGEICRRLDGLALALELAAARVRTLPLKTIREKLDERLRVLTGASRGSLEHHQTMRALIDWSYDLLADPERQLFRRLSVFRGGFALEQLLATCFDGGADELDAIDLVAALVDKSLVQMQSGDEDRYALLESIREYSREKLKESGESDAIADAHVAAFTALAKRFESERDEETDDRWSERARHELDNWRAALGRSLSGDRDHVGGQRLAGSLEPVWARLSAPEGRRWLDAAIASVTADTPPAVIGRLYLARAHLAILMFVFEESLEAANQAIEHLDPATEPLDRARAQSCAGGALTRLGQAEAGEAQLRAALETFKSLGSRRNAASSLQFLAVSRLVAGDLDSARTLFGEARENLRSIKGAERPAAHIALVLAEIEFRSGDPSKALELGLEALGTDRAHRDETAIIFDLCNIAAYLVAMERYGDAAATGEEALELALEANAEVGLVLALQHLAVVSAMRSPIDGEDVRRARSEAAELLGYVDACMERIGARREYTEQHGYDGALTSLREFLGSDEPARLMAGGAAWDQERAVAAARWIVAQLR